MIVFRVSLLAAILHIILPFSALASLPAEPVAIGDDPQFLFDNYIVDNFWAVKYKRESMKRKFHQPVKYSGNPVVKGDGGYVTVLRDAKTGMFRMWYQTAIVSPSKEVRTQYAIAYAESKNGVDWKLPELGLYQWKGSKENNIVWRGIRGKRASGAWLAELPKKARKGYRFVLLYRETDGMHLIGSKDGIHWDRTSDVKISSIHSDTLNSLVFDPQRKEYVIYCRAKHIYRTFRGSILYTGASRRIARMASSDLWSLWKSEPQNILLPDEIDAKRGFHFFYGMPVKIYGGVYWGFLWPFKMNDAIDTELAFSRDGIDFHRLPSHPKLIELGEKGTWDDGMVFGCPWVEVDDEWWIYYAGWDGPHNTRKRHPGIGLTKMRKEGFISMQGPSRGGVITTRKLTWPGGNLVVNANAKNGLIKARITDAKRKVLKGFDYPDCIPLTDDAVVQQMKWNNASIASLAGQTIRIEFYLQNAGIYTFRAFRASPSCSSEAGQAPPSQLFN